MAFNGVKEEDIDKVYPVFQLRSNYEVDDDSDGKSNTECWDCAWSPDKSLFAWSCGQQIVKIVPVHLMRSQCSTSLPENEIVTIDCGRIVTSVAFGASRTPRKDESGLYHKFHWEEFHLILATGLRNGRIRTWNVKTGKVLLELVDHEEAVTHICFAPNGSLMVSAAQDYTIKVWDMEDDGNLTKTLQTSLTGFKHIVNCLVWSPDAKRIASAGKHKTVFTWDIVQRKVLRKFIGHYHDVSCCDFSPDGVLLVTSSYDTSSIVWNSYTGEVLCTLGHLFPPPSPIFAGGANDTYVRSSRFCKDGLIVSTVADDGFARFWDLRSHKVPMALCKLEGGLCSAYKPDCAVLAVGTSSGCVYIIDVPKIVLPLVHICRIAINKLIPDTASISRLPLPETLKDYLYYNKFEM